MKFTAQLLFDHPGHKENERLRSKVRLEIEKRVNDPKAKKTEVDCCGIYPFFVIMHVNNCKIAWIETNDLTKEYVEIYVNEAFGRKELRIATKDGVHVLYSLIKFSEN